MRISLIFAPVLLALCLTVPAAQAVVYVDQNAPGPEHNGQSWDTAFLTIQEGVNAATPDGDVWVADGTYVETITLGFGVQLYGGFLGAEPGGYESDLSERDPDAHVATIDANWSGSAMTIAGDTSGRALVDGFRLEHGEIAAVMCTDGAITVRNCNICWNTGPGVCCAFGSAHVEDSTIATSGNGITGNNASLWIQGNRIQSNNGSGITVALCHAESGCPVTAVGNLIADNHTDVFGGGIYAVVSSLVLTANTICDNSSEGDGGGISCRSSGIAAEGNRLTGNTAAGRGGGIYLESAWYLARGNEILGNAADVGGGVYAYRCTGSWETNVISGNTARLGGGMYAFLGVDGGVVKGNTISANTGTESAGGLHATAMFIEGNLVIGNTSGGPGGGVVASYPAGYGSLIGNTIAGNHSDTLGGGLYLYDSTQAKVGSNCIIANDAPSGGGIAVSNCQAPLGGNTLVGNQATYGRGLAFDSSETPSEVTIANTILWDGGDEIWNNDGSTITITYSDVQGGWPGEGNIDADPMLAHPQAGDWHLTWDSPCLDSGTNSPPGGLPPTDWEGDDRIINGTVDMGADEYIGTYTEAPKPQPGCGGPLFGGSQSGFPAWVWFSIPLTPDGVPGSGSADPNTLLGFDCKGKLWYWDKYGKWSKVYQPPFIKWDLAVGNSYLLRLTGDVTNPGYWGLSPFTPSEFEFLKGRQGWTWVGMPGLTELTGDTFMDSVRVKYPSDDTGVYRTAREDRAAIPDNWVSWAWAFYDTYLQGPKTFTPYAPFGNRTCYPWLGYRCWVQVGTAQSEDDPDQVALIWPKSQ